MVRSSLLAKFEWEPWLEDGLLKRAGHGGGSEESMPRIRRAWDRVVEARAAYLRNDWDATDTRVREALFVATDALFAYSDFKPAAEIDMDFAYQTAKTAFTLRLAEPIFDKARLLRSLMPLPDEISPETARFVRRSVAASSEYVALVESHVFL